MKFSLFTALAAFCSSFAMARLDYAGTPSSRNQNFNIFDINIVCSIGKETDECFSHQESIFEKLGCRLDKDKCETMDQERSFSENGTMLCKYKSNNCKIQEGKSCEKDSKLKMLDGSPKRLVCLYDDVQKSATYANCSEALKETKTDNIFSAEQIIQRLDGLLAQFESYGTSSAGQVHRRAVKSKIMNANEKCYGLSNEINSKLSSIENIFRNMKVSAKPGNPKIKEIESKGATY